MNKISIKSLDELIESGLIELGRGIVISKKDIADCTGKYPVYSSAKENDGKFGEYGKYMFDEELITWSVDGGGRLFHRPKHKFSVTNVGGTLRILDTNVLSYRYLYYVLTMRHAEIAFDWVLKAHPSTIRKLYKDIPILSLPEQKRIVAILDEAFAGIATAKANAEQNLKNARELFESHLQAVFSERGEEWVDITLGELAEFKNGLNFTKSSNGQTLPVVGVGDFQNHDDLPLENLGSVTIDGKLSDDYLIKRNDILTVRSNGSKHLVGRCILVPEINEDTSFSGFIIRIRCNESVIEPRFLLRYMKTRFIRERLTSDGGGANITNINQAKLTTLPVVLPPLKVQREIVKKLEVLLSETNILETIYQQKIAALDELKKAVLHKAFSGEL